MDVCRLRVRRRDSPPRIITAMLGLLEADRVELAWFGRAGRRGWPGWLDVSVVNRPAGGGAWHRGGCRV
jgi:hypothetical protein